MAESAQPLDVQQLVEDHHQAVYRYAYRLAGSEPDAEDLSQQVFLIAQQKIGQLRDPERARSWLFTVLRRCFLKEVRKPAPLPAASLELDVEHLPDPRPDEPIDREGLAHALEELPSEFRLVVVMFYFEHCSYREISTALEVPIGTVMSRLSRAKTHLRRRLLADEAPLGPAPGSRMDASKG